MNTYGHYEFDELLKDEENSYCFDCGTTPAHWASVNNAIFLCLICSGVHRGFGVGVSYVRSVTLDTWTDNQISLMKAGGNKNCREILDVYEINRSSIDRTILYSSILMEFYRKYLKAKVYNIPFELKPPSKDDALNVICVDISSTVPDSCKYSSVSTNGTSYRSVSLSFKDDEKGFYTALNTWMAKAFDSSKYIAYKVGEWDIGKKIIHTGELITGTGATLLDKGTEVAKSEKVQTFAKRASRTLNSVINHIFGGRKSSINVVAVATTETMEKEDHDAETFKK